MIEFNPQKRINSKQKVIISHGSGGLGSAEYELANFLDSLGVYVIFNNYFERNGIDKLYWCSDTRLYDTYNTSFQDILHMNIADDELDCLHIGISLGGYVGLYNAEKFKKNFIFYPGIIFLTDSLINKDYSNTEVFLAQYDNWCLQSYLDLHQSLQYPPNVHYLSSYHGFMIPDKDKVITNIACWKTNSIKVTDAYLEHAYLNSYWLLDNFVFENKCIRLKYDSEASNWCKQYIALRILNEDFVNRS